MKKIIASAFILTSIIGGLASCKKCTTCTVTYPTKDAKGDSAYTRPEYCGNNWQIKSYEKSFYDAWSIKGDISCEQESMHKSKKANKAKK